MGTASSPSTVATMRPRHRIGKYPARARVTVTQALALELGCSESVAHKRAYAYPTIRDLGCALARSYLTAGDEPALQRFLHDIQAAARRMPGRFDIAQLLEFSRADANDDVARTALVAFRNRETFLAWRQQLYQTMGLALGLIEAGNAEFAL